MESTQPRLHPVPGATVPERAPLTAPHAAAAHGPVMLWDPRPARLHVVSRLISACGARPWWIREASTIPHVVRSCRCPLAVVALGGGPPPGQLALEHIRSLKRQGCSVLGYEDGARSWPLRIRCQVLLAGASWVLDSTQAEFVQELHRLLVQHLQAEDARQDEEHRVKHVMQALGSVGESQAMMAVFRTVLRVSTLSDLPVLLTGETGTGKELLAHAIHQLDRKRCHGPFVAINCSAISPGLAESELFGHRRGAFTGADRDRKGLIRAAEGGVLFLDEIGEMDAALQAKLLRVLQEHRVLGVGDDHEVAVSVRIIAATNRNLDAMAQQRTFRADLLHRLHVLAIHIPPLRERPADIKPLIEHFLEKYQGLRPACALSADPEFVEALTQLQLPGNARELENLVRWALVNKDDEAPLTLRDLPLDIWQQLAELERDPWSQSAPADREQTRQTPAPHVSPQELPTSMVHLLDSNGWNLARALQDCERLFLEAALHQAHGNQSHVARLLGITPRSVYNKVHKHHLHR
jgi:transcriptional regulator with GAF, ATPase, and Fis domain